MYCEVLLSPCLSLVQCSSTDVVNSPSVLGGLANVEGTSGYCTSVNLSMNDLATCL